MFELSEEHRQIQELARDFARGEVMPGAAERDKTHKFPAELIAQLGELGFMGMFVDPEYGGAGMDVLSYVLALEEICYADAAVGTIMSVNNSLVCWPLMTFGTHEQKTKYLTPLAMGEKLGCYALTEPGAGSDAGAQSTTVRKDGDHYVLDGTKMWITNGPQAHTIVTYANMDVSARHRGVCAFIVERDFEGYSVGKIEEKLGIACSGTSELVFDGLRVPAETLIGTERAGVSVAREPAAPVPDTTTHERSAAAASPPDATTHESRRVAAAHALRLPEPPAERSFCRSISGGRDGVRQREKRRAPAHAGRVRRAQEGPRGQEVAPLRE